MIKSFIAISRFVLVFIIFLLKIILITVIFIFNHIFLVIIFLILIIIEIFFFIMVGFNGSICRSHMLFAIIKIIRFSRLRFLFLRIFSSVWNSSFKPHVNFFPSLSCFSHSLYSRIHILSHDFLAVGNNGTHPYADHGCVMTFSCHKIRLESTFVAIFLIFNLCWVSISFLSLRLGEII